jgi:uncharacterized phage-like protein YoqJ
MKENTCCFFGHREIVETARLRQNLANTIENLITEKNVDTFLFGSKSCFDNLCLEVVTQIKEKHPHIKRIYVRGEHPYINDNYKKYLLKLYDDTYYPEKIINAGKAVYVERNYEMIDSGKYCVVYYNEQNVPTNRKSGTKIALDYAVKKRKIIINICDL